MSRAATPFPGCPRCGASAPLQTLRRDPLLLGLCPECGLLRGARPERPAAVSPAPPRAATPSPVLPPRAATPSPALPPRAATPSPALPPRAATPRPAPPRPPAPPAARPGPPPPPAAGRPTPPVPPTPPPGPAASGPRVATPPPSLDPGFGYPRVLVGLAAEPLRQALRDALLVSGVAEDVSSVKDGGSLLTAFAKACAAGSPPSVVILDVALPLLDGKNVSILLRAVEDAFGVGPVPLLLWTEAPNDPNLMKLLGYVRNARYLQRDAQQSPADAAHAVLGFFGVS